MTEQTALEDFTGQFAMEERDICRAVSDTLHSNYPGYAWRVGTTLTETSRGVTGAVVVELCVPLASVVKPTNNTKGFLIYAHALHGPGGVRKVILAGGEVLERWGLPREKAPADWVEQAWEHGLDETGSVVKSKA